MVLCEFTCCGLLFPHVSKFKRKSANELGTDPATFLGIL
jgi:hypothetical protein